MSPKANAAVLCAAVAVALLVGPFWNAGGPLSAKVVDGETGEPIPGVIALAHWGIQGGGVEGGGYFGPLLVREAVTDSTGVFRLPGWGPRLVTVALDGGTLRNEDPEVALIKSGYTVEVVNSGGALNTSHIRTSTWWNGRTIALRKFQGSLQEYSQYLSGKELDLLYELSTGHEPCAWEGAPLTIRFSAEEANVFEQARIEHHGLYQTLAAPRLGNSSYQSCRPVDSVIEVKHD